MTSAAASRYSALVISLHWVTAIIIGVLLLFGEDMMKVEGGEGSPFLRTTHIGLGTLVLALTLLRLVWRLAQPGPSLPPSMNLLQQRLAKIGHAAIYGLMLALPLTGLLAASVLMSRGVALNFPGGIALPDFGLTNELWLDLHGLTGNAMIGLLVIHVAAALKHQFFDRDGLLARMIPIRALERG